MEWIGMGLLAVCMFCLGFAVGAEWRSRARPALEWQQSFLSGMMAVFHEGEIANQYGAEFAENPYDAGSPESRAWVFGYSWMDSRRDEITGSATVDLEIDKRHLNREDLVKDISEGHALEAEILGVDRDGQDGT